MEANVLVSMNEDREREYISVHDMLFLLLQLDHLKHHVALNSSLNY